jgi:hypothetical protein
VRVVVVLMLLAGVAHAQAPPDLSGVWAPYRAGRGADPKLNPPPATPIVLKSQYAKPYEARRAAEDEAIKRGEPLGTAAVQCIPYGFPRMMAVALYPAEIIQRPSQITIITEAFSEVRRVFMNQPQLPIDEVPPGYYGHSVGKWDGDTLVVDTVGFAEGVLVPPTRNSPQLHVVERYTLDPKTFALKREYTVEDPVYLAAPYTGQDTVLLSETPFEKQPCSELTFEFTQRGN